MITLILLISLHFATVFNGLMSLAEDEYLTPDKAAAVWINNAYTLVCFVFLIIIQGWIGAILFFIDLLLSLYLVKYRSILPFLKYYLKMNLFIPIFWFICAITNLLIK